MSKSKSPLVVKIVTLIGTMLVLFIPLIYPLLYACVTATTAAICGGEFWMDSYTMPLVMAAGYDVIMLALCWVLYDFIISA